MAFLRKILLIMAITPLFYGCGGSESTAEVVRSSDRPNIIFIFTDDHGYADLGAQGAVNDIQTPHLDAMAAAGARMTAGYATAPQCTPSRAALMTGYYQQTFGVDDNRYSPLPLSVPTLAEKLTDIGYKTGIVGKWHLDVNGQSRYWYEEVYAPGSSTPYDQNNIPFAEKLKYFPESRGFQDNFVGYTNKYRANFNLQGDNIGMQTLTDNRFRVDVTSDAAVAFIERHKADPFFLYLAYYAPHVPLEATDEYLSLFPEDMPQRRRYALAMLAAIDKGVGRIQQTLTRYGLDDDTLIVFMGDNGAALALTMEDAEPINSNGPEWNGSLNTPWVGEKGMLSDGGIRIPFLMKWSGHIPAGLVYEEPVITLDATTTAATIAGLDSRDMHGLNLLPYLADPQQKPERALFWRFIEQSAIRQGNWKYLRTDDNTEYLFDLANDQTESVNLIHQYPAQAATMHNKLAAWASANKHPGLGETSTLRGDIQRWYTHYFGQ